MGLSQPVLLYFCLFCIVQLTDKFLPMLGFKPRISGIGSDHSATCATTTASSRTSVYCIWSLKPLLEPCTKIWMSLGILVFFMTELHILVPHFSQFTNILGKYFSHKVTSDVNTTFLGVPYPKWKMPRFVLLKLFCKCEKPSMLSSKTSNAIGTCWRTIPLMGHCLSTKNAVRFWNIFSLNSAKSIQAVPNLSHLLL